MKQGLYFLVVLALVNDVLSTNNEESKFPIVKSRQKRQYYGSENSSFDDVTLAKSLDLVIAKPAEREKAAIYRATLCFFTNLVIPVGLFYEGVNWGISYDLPNATTVKEMFNSNKYALKRRQRRDLYNRFETVLEKMGFAGKQCIYKALCEAPRKLNKKNNTLRKEILNLFFKYPLKRLSHQEPDDHRKYHWARRYSLENTHLDCMDLFPDCSISIVDIMTGIK